MLKTDLNLNSVPNFIVIPDRLKPNSIYKHRSWFLGANKTKQQAIEYLVDSDDFVLALKSNIRHIEDLTNRVEILKNKVEVNEIVDFLAKNSLFDDLVIKYTGREKGTDANNTHIEIFYILQQAKKAIYSQVGEV